MTTAQEITIIDDEDTEKWTKQSEEFAQGSPRRACACRSGPSPTSSR